MPAGDVEHEDGVGARGNGVHGCGLARSRLRRLAHKRRRCVRGRDAHRRCSGHLRVPACTIDSQNTLLSHSER